jgi:mannose/fructose/N-acetylgalactosamine-specific phosphotransferase system component IIB
MKLAMVRVDERLIHGQVTMGWTRSLGANVILVANDDVANDPMQKNLMMLAAPPSTTVEVLGLDATVEKLSSKSWPDGTILLLVRNPVDLLYLVGKGLSLDQVNVGGVRQESASIKLTKEVSATEEELEAWKRLDERGIRIEVQWLPGQSSKSLNEVLRKYR